MNDNVITKEDDIAVINAKLRSPEYAGMNDEQIHNILVRDACYNPNIFIIKNGQLVRR